MNPWNEKGEFVMRLFRKWAAFYAYNIVIDGSFDLSGSYNTTRRCLIVKDIDKELPTRLYPRFCLEMATFHDCQLLLALKPNITIKVSPN